MWPMVKTQPSLVLFSQPVCSAFSIHLPPVLLVQVAGLMWFAYSSPTRHSEHLTPNADVDVPTQNSQAVRSAFGCLPGPHDSQRLWSELATFPCSSHGTQSPSPRLAVPAVQSTHLFGPGHFPATHISHTVRFELGILPCSEHKRHNPIPELTLPELHSSHAVVASESWSVFPGGQSLHEVAPEVECVPAWHATHGVAVLLSSSY